MYLMLLVCWKVHMAVGWLECVCMASGGLEGV